MASASRWRVGALVELALGDGLLVPQALRALVLALGVRHARLRGGDLRLGALDLGGIGRGVDGDQQVALLDQRAFAEMHRLHGAGDARADVDALDRFEPAGELVPGGHVALHHGGDGNRRGRRFSHRRAASLGAGSGHAKDRHRHAGDDQNGQRDGEQTVFIGLQVDGWHGGFPRKMKKLTERDGPDS